MATVIHDFKVGDKFQAKEFLPYMTINREYEVLSTRGYYVTFVNDVGKYDDIWMGSIMPVYYEENNSTTANRDNDTKNNGGETDYYKIKEDWKTAQDIIEARKMNFAQGNIFKVAITFNVGRHQGTDYLRELNKMEYFIKREKKRIAKEGI